jgi:5-dehydro-4-deoxyglucarate dehydratase
VDHQARAVAAKGVKAMDFDAVRGSLRGPAALISTIFHEDFSLDDEAIERNVRSMFDRGFGKGGGFLIAPCGDGEYVTLSPEENARVVAAAIRGSDGSVPVVAGVQSFDYRLAAHTAEGARRAGAVAVMMAPPVYYTLNDEAIADWYERFGRTVDIGIMLYEQAWRGPMVNAGIRPDLVGRLLDIPSVVAMKHVGIFTLPDVFAILDRYHDRFAYIDSSGCYAMTAGHMHGAAGYVSEFAPLWPEFEMRYWDLLEAGQYGEAELSRQAIAPLQKLVGDHPSSTTAYSWISVIKAALEYVGLTGGPLRPPFRALNAAEKAEVFRTLESMGVPTAQPQPA